MKAFIGVLLILGGVVLGIYVGVVVCFVGGITDIINQIKSPNPVEASIIAWGIAKIVLATAAGVVSAIALIIPGGGMIFKAKIKGR